MREVLVSVIAILGAFTAIGLACAVRIGRRSVRPDPFAVPFGEMPGFTAEQLARLAPRPRSSDPLRRSFTTETASVGVALRRRADGGFPFILSGSAAVRKFFRGQRHA